MRYAIFADIHGNLEAFNTVLLEYSKENIDAYYCVGDIVGYGACPNECIDKIKEISATVVAGNHDWAAVGKKDTAYFNPAAKEAIEWTSKNINLENQEYLKSLNLIFENEDFTLVHGSLDIPEEFEYLTDLFKAKETFGLLKTNVCFVGHSHIPEVFELNSGEVDYIHSSYVELSSDKKYIINVGSVGQPRDGNPRACYSIFDSADNTVSIKRIPYFVEKTQQEIIRTGLPTILAERLLRGR